MATAEVEAGGHLGIIARPRRWCSPFDHGVVHRALFHDQSMSLLSPARRRWALGDHVEDTGAEGRQGGIESVVVRTKPFSNRPHSRRDEASGRFSRSSTR